jgi:phenylacetate-coenzyme A ligase PaaK-like adenylate-forming protein
MARISPIAGWRADLLEVDGVRCFPSQVERVPLAHLAVGTAWQIVLDAGGAPVHCEPRCGAADTDATAEQVRAAVPDRLGVLARVVVERRDPAWRRECDAGDRPSVDLSISLYLTFR